MDEQAQSTGRWNRKKIIIALVSGLALVILVSVFVVIAVTMGGDSQTVKKAAELTDQRNAGPTAIKYIPPLKCKFPMKYKGRSYNDCTTADSSYPWCLHEGRRFYCPAATTAQGICAIPFNYRGTTHYRCANYNNKYFWCALTPLFQSGMWGKCDPAMVASPNCALPFKYKGRQYWSCTNTDAYFHWCSYTTDYIAGGWDYCHPPHIEADPSCKFPFTYKGYAYSSCTTKDDDNYWCSRTNVYDGDWVYCANTAVQPADNCKLPFWYNSRLYHNCILQFIKKQGHHYWCSTSNVYDGRWEYCTKSDDSYRI